MIFYFTDDEMRWVRRWAEERHGSHRPEDERKFTKKYTGIQIHTLGIKAEFAIYQTIGGKWLRYDESKTDPGWEIVDPFGLKIQVKGSFTPRADFYPRNGEAKKWDIGVGVSAIRDVEHMTINGFIRLDKFKKLARDKRFGKESDGYNVVKTVGAEHLTPIQELHPGESRLPPNIWELHT